MDARQDQPATDASGPLTVDAIDGGYGVLREDGTIIYATLGEDATDALQWAIDHSQTINVARTLPISRGESHKVTPKP